MGNRESHECIDVDSVEQEAGLLGIKTHLSKFDDIEDEYFTHNPHFKCTSFLINARIYVKHLTNEDEDIERFIDRILCYSNMKRCPYSEEAQNILIVNGNRKFTFLNTTNQDIRNNPCLLELWKKGETKLRREYGDQWIEGCDDDRRKYSLLWVKLYEWEKNEDDHNDFITVCNRIKEKYSNS